MQINVGHLNEEGVYNGQFTTFALTGKVRVMVSSASAGLRGGVPRGAAFCMQQLACAWRQPHAKICMHFAHAGRVRLRSGSAVEEEAG